MDNLKISKRQKRLNEIDEAKRIVEELQKEYNTFIKEQEYKRDTVYKNIEKLLEGKNLFCGVILTEENLLDLIKLKIANPSENIKIKFNVYIEEKDE